ncbi:YegP family protein [Chromobacterium haemolyticum]|uniref:YegP family protein n=1 Tax=Chromobacterium haemolyticum TaxID=394935 RepID=UPI00244C3399|nr:YegP family protein [Chromobacterium haemolyticum]MDH0344416.1 YegP family protein [Chromobacterium haemolyticum]
MSGHYIIKKTNAAQPYHFVLCAGNNQVILTSENYVNKQGALTGIASCQVNSPDDNRYERKESTAMQPYSFVLKAANGQVIGRSENYSTHASREAGIASVKANGPTKDIRDESN